MASAIEARLKNLERVRSHQGPNRILQYNPFELNGMVNALRSVGKAGKYMLVPKYSSDSEWESALLRQQRELINEASKRS